MPAIRLDMSFKRADGGNNKITIDDARNDISDQEVNDLMDMLITNDVFKPSGSSLAEKVKIELITTETIELGIL